jgi:carboxy-terminal domain RNA polymerase II polypeptide A small phosphatase
VGNYANPLLDILDKHDVIRHRLFRESCTYYSCVDVKNLNLLGRDLSRTIIVDDSPASYQFHPDNAVNISRWFHHKKEQENDDELRILQDFCEVIENEEEVRHHLRHWRQGKDCDVKAALAALK